MTVPASSDGPRDRIEAAIAGNRDYLIDGVDDLKTSSPLSCHGPFWARCPRIKKGGHPLFSPPLQQRPARRVALFPSSGTCFSQLDIVFFRYHQYLLRRSRRRTPSAQRGFSKDHRPDFEADGSWGAVINDQGQPICCEMWPGQHHRRQKPCCRSIDRLQTRFPIGQVLHRGRPGDDQCQDP